MEQAKEIIEFAVFWVLPAMVVIAFAVILIAYAIKGILDDWKS